MDYRGVSKWQNYEIKIMREEYKKQEQVVVLNKKELKELLFW